MDGGPLKSGGDAVQANVRDVRTDETLEVGLTYERLRPSGLQVGASVLAKSPDSHGGWYAGAMRASCSPFFGERWSFFKRHLPQVRLSGRPQSLAA